jgi:hypothetical protein
MLFTCPDQPNKSVYASIDDLAGADDDGIQLKSGAKYHFNIDGRSKHDVQTLFAHWTSGVCVSAVPTGGFTQPTAVPGFSARPNPPPQHVPAPSLGHIDTHR